jgi:hypothetical protein
MGQKFVTGFRRQRALKSLLRCLGLKQNPDPVLVYFAIGRILGEPLLRAIAFRNCPYMVVVFMNNLLKSKKIKHDVHIGVEYNNRHRLYVCVVIPNPS